MTVTITDIVAGAGLGIAVVAYCYMLQLHRRVVKIEFLLGIRKL